MSLLYINTINNPNDDVAGLPPSVMASDWLENLQLYKSRHAVFQSANTSGFIFDDVAALNSFLNTYKLKDTTLISDVSAWNTAHGITHISVYYSLGDGTSIPGLV
jgi:hypothetical protein